MGTRTQPRLRTALTLAAVAMLVLALPVAGGGPPEKTDPGLQNALDSLNQRARAYGLANHAPPSEPAGDPTLNNFTLVGHNNLGGRDSNGDIWVHEGYAYVGTWAIPCTGRGVKIVDVTDPSAPRVVGSAARRAGTSAEDMVVRSVETSWFSGDLMVVGIQRCGPQMGPAGQYGAEFWDVSDPRHPRLLSRFNITHGGGGAHEVDLIQRGDHVYAGLALPFSEWFDPVPVGDVVIVDVTNPRSPQLVSEWGAVGDFESPPPGPFWGQGSFGASFAHSVRFSDDGNLLYASYWDLGVITLDISGSKIAAPEVVVQTQYPADADGDTHSLTPYDGYLLVNDEDFDPRSPAHVTYGTDGFGVATESPFTPALWEVGPSLTADVVMPSGHGCDAADYDGIDASGAIVVVDTPFDFFAGVGPDCPMPVQEAVAEAEGAAAVVHRWASSDTSPQWFDFSEATIPVLFTDTGTADGMVAATEATLEAQLPTWGYLRVFDAATGEEVSHFDAVDNINDLDAADDGFWSIHNTEVDGNVAYAAWYSNGIIALDLGDIENITELGQFIPPGEPAEVWGVFIGDNGLIYASDLGSGLWIIEPKF